MKCVLATCRAFIEDGEPLSSDDRLLREALVAQGFSVEIVPWEADYPWYEADVVKICSTWNYYTDVTRFRQWAEWVAHCTRLFNPLPAILWNLEKGRYFADLQRQGIALLPTCVLHKGEDVNLAEQLERQGWNQAVIKPSIGANSAGCLALNRDDAGSLAQAQAHLASLLPQQDVLLQPYIGSVAQGLESSHVFVQGLWSHAFARTAFAPRLPNAPVPTGEQPLLRPASAEVAYAGHIMQTVEALLGLTLLYGRVDLVRDDAGQLLVMEVEMIEPFLHLEQGQALPMLVRAIADGIRQTAVVLQGA